MKKRMNLGAGAAFALTFGLLLTGCSANPEPVAPAPNTGVVETAKPTASTPVESAKPTAKPSASTKAELEAEGQDTRTKQEKTPLGIDISEALKSEYASDDVKAAVKANEYSMENAIHTGLSVYQDLIYTENFYTERVASNDFDLFNVPPLTDRMDADFIARTEAGVKKTGKLNTVFTMNKNGEFVYTDKKGKKHSYVVTHMPSNTFGPIAMTITDAGTVSIAGWRYMTLPTETETLLIESTYEIEVTIVGDDEFRVNHISEKLITDEGVSNVGK